MGDAEYKAEQARKRRERRARTQAQTQAPTEAPTQEVKQAPQQTRRSKTPQRTTKRTPPPERKTDLTEQECYLLLSKKYDIKPKIPSRDTEQYRQTMERLKRIKKERLEKQNEADDEEIRQAMERKRLRNQPQEIKQREIKQREIKQQTAKTKRYDPMECLENVDIKTDEATLKTLKMYSSNINIIYKLMNNGEMWDCKFNFLKDIEKVIKAIDEKYNNKATASKYINSITSILKRVKGYKTLYNKYSKINDERKKALQAIAQENKLSDRELKNYIKWDEIINEPYKLKLGKIKAENILYVLYVAIPPRRAEYRTLYYSNDPNPADKTKNYLVMEGFQPVKLILNNYKTAKTYGQYTADLRNNEMFKFYGKSKTEYYNKYFKPEKQQEILQEYKTGLYPVFPSEKFKGLKQAEAKEPFITEATYIKRVKEAFEQGNKKPSINLLRHSFITYTRQNQNLSIGQKKAIAEQMGHSKDTADLYEKING